MDAERRKKNIDQKHASDTPVLNSSTNDTRAYGRHAERGGQRQRGRDSGSQRRNGKYLFMIGTLLTVSIGLNVMQYSMTGGGSNNTSIQAAEAFVAHQELQNTTCLELHPTPKLQTELKPNQLALVQKYAAGKKSYLEWGTGGSTDVVSRLIDGPAFSIENHPQWCQKVQTTPYVACRIKAGSFSFQCVDTGPVRDYGNPKNEQDIPKFANYVQAVKKFGLPTFDFIMDDGRSRVAVAFQSFQYMHEDSILAIHDFPEDDKDERIDYKRVEEYFERMKDSVGTKIAILRKRPGSQGPPADVLEKELANYH